MAQPFPTNLEYRQAVEVTPKAGRLTGYAASFGVEARIGTFIEVIERGAFKISLAQQSDVLALVDHDPGRLLARTKSGTLRLSEDERGLSFDLSIPDTQLGRDIQALAERGDLGGMSFGFRVSPEGERWQGNKRQLVSIELREISVVQSWPAYTGTTVQARSQTPQLNQRRRYLETL